MQVITLKKTKISLKDFMLIISFTLLMVLSSYIKIPLFFSPVPVTLQNFIIFLSIATLNSKAFIPQLLYLSLGFVGLPVFSNGGSGFLYFMGPTGGYLLGFLLSSAVFGSGYKKYFYAVRIKILFLFVVFSLTALLIYLSGIFWLMVAFRFSLSQAISLGVAPFILPDALKIILASLIVLKVLKRC